MSDWALQYIETLEIENGTSKKSQTTITFYTDVPLSPIIYQDARNWKQNLNGNSNDINFLLGYPIESHNISRRS